MIDATTLTPTLKPVVIAEACNKRECRVRLSDGSILKMTWKEAFLHDCKAETLGY